MTQLHYTIDETINHWQYVEPYATVPKTKREYKKQLDLLNNLMELTSHERDKHIANLLQLIARNLEIYENEHLHLNHPTPIDVLQFLMDEHGLTQGDLPEIGSQSLVSKILRGERNLTTEQIANLAHRFNVSPAVFINLCLNKI